MCRRSLAFALCLPACGPGEPPDLLPVGPDAITIVDQVTSAITEDFFRSDLEQYAEGDWSGDVESSEGDAWVSADWYQDVETFTVDALVVEEDAGGYAGTFQLSGPWLLADTGDPVLIFDTQLALRWQETAGYSCSVSMPTGTATYTLDGQGVATGVLVSRADIECDGATAYCDWTAVDMVDRDALVEGCSQ